MKTSSRIIVLILLAAMLLQTTMIPFSYADTQVGDGSASSWATSEIQEAIQYGLTYDDILSTYQKPITREEFCIVVVKLYEKISGKTAPAGQNPFSDTSNSEIIKANQLGIVFGTGDGRFSPNNSITRQELCTMILRALKAAKSGLSTGAPALSGFGDTDKIASWASDAVRFCVKHKIIKGVGKGSISPLGNTTREQAIVIAKRTYESFKDPDYDNLTAFELIDDPKSTLTEAEKFAKLDLSNRLSSPNFDTKSTLYVASGPGKPSSFSTASIEYSKPDTPSFSFAALTNYSLISKPDITTNLTTVKKVTPKTGLRYTNAPFTFIDSGSDQKRYFAFNLKTSSAAKVVWQVAKAPFNGYPDGWQKPAGLVASGQVTASSKEFVIDFSKFALSPTPPAGTWLTLSKQLVFKVTNTYREIPKKQRNYYVRAVPVDSNGKCVGDPGTGLSVIFGKPSTDNHLPSMTTAAFQLWHAREPGTPSYQPVEFPNLFSHETNMTIGVSPSSSDFYFQPQKFDAGATKIVMQVLNTPASSKTYEWENPTGLVYSKTYDVGKIPDANGFKNAMPVKFSSFGLSETELGKNKVEYYVRAIALKPADTQPGTTEPTFSDTIKVVYSNPSPVKLFQPKTITVPAYAPTMEFERYIPVAWEDSEWSHYYEVFRAPKWNEVNFKLHNNKTGGTLYPYSHYAMQGMSASEYENQLVPQYLVPGSGFKVVVRQEDKSWWGELWDTITDFFSSIVDIITSVANWASSTFNSLKMGIINTIAANFPLIPNEWRDELTTALTALADYGLASIGIPPNLPNFDELMSGGLDYAVTVAAQEAGIPANALTDAAKSELEKQIMDKATLSTDVTGPNPLNCAFIKPDHRYQYMPAYIDVKLYDNNTKPSPTGTLSIRIEDENWPWFPVYDYVNLPVPSLQPGKSTFIRVYLKEYTNKPYPGDTPFIPSDFSDMYWGRNGKKCKFDIRINYNLPDAKIAAQAMGLDQIPNKEDYILSYAYDKASDSESFIDIPCNGHYYWQQ